MGNEPAWHPDPGGQHEYRWWDGARWTDQVSNGGVASTAPLAGAGSPEPAASTPPVAPGAKKPFPWVPAVIGLVVAVGVVVTLVLLLGGGDETASGSGPGVYEGDFTIEQPVALYKVSVGVGESFRVRAEPVADDTDLVLAIATDRATATQIVEAFLSDSDSDSFYSSTEDAFSDFFSDSDEFYFDTLGLAFSQISDLGLADAEVIVESRDWEGEDDAEAAAFYSPVAGTYFVIVGDYEQRPRPYRLFIEEGPRAVDPSLVFSSDFDSAAFADLDEFFYSGSFYSDERFYEDGRDISFNS